MAKSRFWQKYSNDERSSSVRTPDRSAAPDLQADKYDLEPHLFVIDEVDEDAFRQGHPQNSSEGILSGRGALVDRLDRVPAMDSGSIGRSWGGSAVPPARPESPYRADTTLDGWGTDWFQLRAASIRGMSHRSKGIPRQDDFAAAFHHQSQTLVVAVADGVSMAPQSHLGATAVARSAVDEIVKDLDRGKRISWRDLFERSSWALVELAQRSGGRRDPREAERLFATTLTVLMISRKGSRIELECTSIGDSGCVLFSPHHHTSVFGGKDYRSPIYTNETNALPRLPRDVPTERWILKPGDLVFAATDGILDPMLADPGRLSGFARNLQVRIPANGLDFAERLNSSSELSDDDKTIVAVWVDR
jgi:hypothetical protein